jgi:hypothetical protein
VRANNLSGPISQTAFLREGIADNAAIAGQNELNRLTLNQNIVMTVLGVVVELSREAGPVRKVGNSF